MPLRVPGGTADMPIPLLQGPKPSETDYAMALATMKRLGRLTEEPEHPDYTFKDVAPLDSPKDMMKPEQLKSRAPTTEGDHEEPLPVRKDQSRVGQGNRRGQKLTW
jgi:hypothetical protein